MCMIGQYLPSGADFFPHRARAHIFRRGVALLGDVHHCWLWRHHTNDAGQPDVGSSTYLGLGLMACEHSGLC